uniref:Pigment dispersing factor n=1 Tax=Steinernema glaseri TaxID=37863 RepID=A0A1I8AWJ9_9BILA
MRSTFVFLAVLVIVFFLRAAASDSAYVTSPSQESRSLRLSDILHWVISSAADLQKRPDVEREIMLLQHNNFMIAV